MKYSDQIFYYDGLISDDGMEANGALRCAVDDELGLLWCASDIVRLLGLEAANSTQLVEYSPDHTVRITNPKRSHMAVRFTAHPVVMQWLLNRPAHHDLRRLIDEWAKLRKFPICAAPAGMPEPKNPEVRARASVPVSVADGWTPGGRAFMTHEQRQEERFHRSTTVDGKPVRLLYVAEDPHKPDDVVPFVSWVDACAFMSENMGVKRTSHVEQIQKFFRDSASQIHRVRSRNGDHVIIISLDLFVYICAIWGSGSAYLDMVEMKDGVKTPDRWRAEARRFGNRRKEFRDMQPASRKLSPRLNEIGAPRRTARELQTQDWAPTGSKPQQERTRAEAEAAARREMGSYSEMLKNIKPE
jgi:hypothetical protein